mmetsp:Transcript_11643/g.8119  ORF Transcript_11643/g.8119 Transcript_11643/m.8119 type:complete len:303 (+) Transcript_11643:601-1509(+)
MISTVQSIRPKTRIVDLKTIEDITINEVSPLIKTKTYLTAQFIRTLKDVASQKVEVALCHRLNMTDIRAARTTNLPGQSTINVEKAVMSIVTDHRCDTKMSQVPTIGKIHFLIAINLDIIVTRVVRVNSQMTWQGEMINTTEKEVTGIIIVAIETTVGLLLLRLPAENLLNQDPRKMTVTEKDMDIRVIELAREKPSVDIVVQEGATVMNIMIDIERTIEGQDELVTRERIVTETTSPTILTSRTKRRARKKKRMRDGTVSSGSKDQGVPMILWQTMSIEKWKKSLVLIKRRIRSVLQRLRQ